MNSLFVICKYNDVSKKANLMHQYALPFWQSKGLNSRIHNEMPCMIKYPRSKWQDSQYKKIQQIKFVSTIVTPG